MSLLKKLFILFGTIISNSRNGVSLEFHITPKFDCEGVPKFPERLPTLDILRNDDNMDLEDELSTKIYEHLGILPQSDITPDQCSIASNPLTMKYVEKFDTLQELATPLEKVFTGKELRVLLYELVYFLNLISFETSFEMLQTREQYNADPGILVSILGESFVYKERRLDQFYKLLVADIDTIGYWPRGISRSGGKYMSNLVDSLRATVGELISTKDYDIEKQDFAKRVWRVACTLHLTSRIIYAPDLTKPWEIELGSKFYQAIEVGSTEVFTSYFSGNIPNSTIKFIRHAMLVEVTRTGDASYSVKQFNPGSGIHHYHKVLYESDPWSEKRYLSFAHMPNLSEDQIRSTGYFVARDDSPIVGSLKKLYANKNLAQDDNYIDPLIYEIPRQAGTCFVLPMIFYFRSLGVNGRLFEIDFKAMLIKRLLDRLDYWHNNFSYEFVLDMMTDETDLDSIISENSHLFPLDYVDKRDDIHDDLVSIFKTEDVVYIENLLFWYPDIFASLITSVLKELLDTFHWIIKNDKFDIAETLLNHFMKEFEPIFKSESPHALEVLEVIIPSLYGLLIRLFEFPFQYWPTSLLRCLGKALASAFGKSLEVFLLPIFSPRIIVVVSLLILFVIDINLFFLHLNWPL